MRAEPAQAGVSTILSPEVVQKLVQRGVRFGRRRAEGTAALRHTWLGEACHIVVTRTFDDVLTL